MHTRDWLAIDFAVLCGFLLQFFFVGIFYAAAGTLFWAGLGGLVYAGLDAVYRRTTILNPKIAFPSIAGMIPVFVLRFVELSHGRLAQQIAIFAISAMVIAGLMMLGRIPQKG